MWLFFLACVAEPEPAETDPVPPDPPPALLVTDVIPAWANAAGGATLRVLGENFGADPAVTIGGKPAEIVGSNAQWLDVVVPPSTPGYAEVGVDDGIRADRSQFVQLYADRTGFYELFGIVYTFEWPATGRVERGAWAWMTSPQPKLAWQYFSDPLDSCTSHPVDYQVSTDRIGAPVELDAPQLVLSGATTTLTLLRGEDLQYRGTLESWPAGTAFNLEPIDTLGALDGLSVPRAVVLPAAPEVSVPDLSRTDFEITKDQAFVWNVSAPADGVMIQIQTSTERLYCVAVDDGAFDLPPDAWRAWKDTGEVSIAVVRIALAGAKLPHDNATVAIEGQAWEQGTTTR